MFKNILASVAFVAALAIGTSAHAGNLEAAVIAAPSVECSDKNISGDWCFAVFKYPDGTEIEVALRLSKFESRRDAGTAWRVREDPLSKTAPITPRTSGGGKSASR